MNMFNYCWPLLLVVFCNTVYHFISKNTPPGVNPFAVLTVIYGAALAGSFILWLLSGQAALWQDFSQIRPASILMGLAIIGVEGGYLLMYQKGWQISKAGIIANIGVALMLFVIGWAFFNEAVTLPKLSGIILCLLGIYLMSL